jgi:3-oxoacyl-[acyl-carrier-protein] synthase-3
MGADGSQADILNMPAGGALQPATHESVAARMHHLKMQGPEVFKQAIMAMSRAAREALKRCNLHAEDLACVIPHQANLRIIQSLAERLEIPMSKCFITVEKYGNMSAASVIVALDDAARSGRLKKGDLVLLVVFGSGLTWAASIIQW